MSLSNPFSKYKLFPGLLHLTFDTYLIMQEAIKYHCLSAV